MTIRVSSTSFLLPGNRQWNALAEFAPLKFGEYGDWYLALLADDSDPSLCMIFLEDIIPDELPRPEQIDDVLLPLLDPLKMRLARSDAPVVVAFSGWQEFSVIQNARAEGLWRQIAHRFELLLYALATDAANLYLLDMDRVWARNGIKAAFDTRNFYAARCRMSSQGIAQLAASAVSIFERIGSSAKKVLVLDCDNTLWGGVVGEVGTAGILLDSDGLGKAFTNFQKVALQLSRQGVLLILASKNNEAEVWDVFDNHPGMTLKRGDVVAARIDWSEKATNLRAIAAELDLGLSSFVFWDDNPLEREKMRAMCPEVSTPELPADVAQWPDLLRGSDLFARFAITEDDARKGDQYRHRAAFVSERKQITDEIGFLRSIEMEPVILPITSPLLGRAEQLCAKTNQYNLRTIRHSAAEIARFASEEPELTFLVKLTDRFGDHGIIAMVIVRKFDGVAFLDTFLMSCRVLGRHLEAWIVEHIAHALRLQGIKTLVAEFIPSGHNDVSRDFLADHGFSRFNSDEKTTEVINTVKFLALQGEIYFAPLDTVTIPYKDVFTHS